MSVLIALDMVTDVAYPDQVAAYDPLAAEVLAPVDSVHELAAHFALQLAHHLLFTFVLTRAVQPRHRLLLMIKLLERSVSDSPLLSVACPLPVRRRLSL